RMHALPDREVQSKIRGLELRSGPRAGVNARVMRNFRLGTLLQTQECVITIYPWYAKTVFRSRHTHMPKFLRIGVHHSNVSGYTSKAWWVRRVGSTVFLKWGAVEVYGVGDKRKIYWTIPPREKTILSRTLQPAQRYLT